MRRRKMILWGAVAFLAVALIAWRLWPLPLGRLLSARAEEVTEASCYLSVSQYEEGLPNFLSYELTAREPEEIQALLEILDASRYRADFRNLFPWTWGSLQSGRDYDGRVLELTLFFGDRSGQDLKYDFLTCFGSDTMRLGDWRIHPTDKEMFGRLADYVQTHGRRMPYTGSEIVGELSIGITWGMQIWAMSEG